MTSKRANSSPGKKRSDLQDLLAKAEQKSGWEKYELLEEALKRAQKTATPVDLAEIHRLLAKFWNETGKPMYASSHHRLAGKRTASAQEQMSRQKQPEVASLEDLRKKFKGHPDTLTRRELLFRLVECKLGARRIHWLELHGDRWMVITSYEPYSQNVIHREIPLPAEKMVPWNQFSPALKDGETQHFELGAPQKGAVHFFLQPFFSIGRPDSCLLVQLVNGSKQQHQAAMEFLGSLAKDDSLEIESLVTETVEDQVDKQSSMMAVALESLTEGVFWLNQLGEVVYVNEKGARMLDLSPEQIVGKRNAGELFDFAEDQDLAGWSSYSQEILESGSQQLQMRIHTVKGATRDLDISATAFSFGAENLICVIIRDISEKVRTQSAMLETNRKYATLLANLPAMAYRIRWEPDWPREFVSQGSLDLTGHPPEAFTSGKVHYFSLVHPEDREKIDGIVRHAIEIKQPFVMDYRIVDAQGQQKWVRENGEGVYDDNGEIIAIEGIIYDETDLHQKQADLKEKSRQIEAMNAELLEAKLNLEQKVEERTQELRESQELIDRIINNSSAFIFVKDLQGRYILVNQNWSENVGLTPREALGRDDYQIFSEEEAQALRKNDQEVLDTGNGIEYEETVKLSDGRIASYLSVKFPIFDTDGRIVALGGISTDITDRKAAQDELRRTNLELERTLEKLRETQDQLLQKEKMASLGQLTAGIAHEINNPINFVYAGTGTLRKYFERLLTVVKAYDQLSPDNQNLPEALKTIEEAKQKNHYAEVLETIPELLDDIRLGAERTKEIVQGLRNFSRLEQGQKRRTDIREPIDSALLLLRNRSKNQVTIEKDYDSGLPSFDIYPGLIGQVFMNILANAMDALEGQSDGKIIIQTRRSDEWAVISISDNGPGINPDIQKRIFDPFFTTKEEGQGTGLGLSISYGIVEKHQGELSVESQPGQGTEFRIRLPLKSAQAP